MSVKVHVPVTMYALTCDAIEGKVRGYIICSEVISHHSIKHWQWKGINYTFFLHKPIIKHVSCFRSKQCQLWSLQFSYMYIAMTIRWNIQQELSMYLWNCIKECRDFVYLHHLLAHKDDDFVIRFQILGQELHKLYNIHIILIVAQWSQSKSKGQSTQQIL